VSPRTQWVRSWPAMAILAASAIFWSKHVEDAIKGGGVVCVWGGRVGGA